MATRLVVTLDMMQTLALAAASSSRGTAFGVA
jgi:hypothetical protein